MRIELTQLSSDRVHLTYLLFFFGGIKSYPAMLGLYHKPYPSNIEWDQIPTDP